MTTVPPPTAPPLPMATQVPQAPVVTILAPPPAVAALAAGTQLEGVVEKSGSPDSVTQRVDVTVQTSAGDITLKLPAPLPEGTAVDLQIVRASPDQTAVRLLAIDDQPAAPVLTQALAQLRQNPTPATPVLPDPTAEPLPSAGPVLSPGDAWTPKGPIALPQLGMFSAVVVATPPTPTIGTPTAPQTGSAPPVAEPQVFALIGGGTLAVRVAAVSVPDQTQASVPAPAPDVVSGAPVSQPAAPPISGPVLVTPTQIVAPAIATTTPNPVIVVTETPPSQAGTEASPAQLPQALPVGGPAQTPPSALLIAGRDGLPPPPPAPPATVTIDPPQATVTGIVVSTTPNAAPVIATELGQVQLNLRANLPVGTRLVLEIAEQLPPEPGAPLPAAPIASLPLATPTTAWPTVSEAMALLERADPPAAAQLAEIIPDGGPRTALALVAFVQAMRSGDSRQWPGEAPLRALERAGPRGAHLAAQLSDEVSALSSRARETGTEWRALPIPWNAEGRIDRIMLITRREGEAEASGKNKAQSGGTRFLITLALSRLGPMQLDGMFRRTLKGFDLIVRTKAPLPDTMRFDLTGIFAASTAAMGLKGGLAFQVVKTFPDPLARPEAAKPGVWA